MVEAAAPNRAAPCVRAGIASWARCEPKKEPKALPSCRPMAAVSKPAKASRPFVRFETSWFAAVAPATVNRPRAVPGRCSASAISPITKVAELDQLDLLLKTSDWAVDSGHSDTIYKPGGVVDGVLRFDSQNHVTSVTDDGATFSA